MKKADFTRTVITSTIKVAGIKVVNGKTETKDLPPIIVVGSVPINEDKAAKIAREKYPTEAVVVVLWIEIREEVRGMDFDTFYKNSVKIERPLSQRKKEAQ